MGKLKLWTPEVHTTLNAGRQHTCSHQHTSSQQEVEKSLRWTEKERLRKEWHEMSREVTLQTTPDTSTTWTRQSPKEPGATPSSKSSTTSSASTAINGFCCKNISPAGTPPHIQNTNQNKKLFLWKYTFPPQNKAIKCILNTKAGFVNDIKTDILLDIYQGKNGNPHPI